MQPLTNAEVYEIEAVLDAGGSLDDETWARYKDDLAMRENELEQCRQYENDLLHYEDNVDFPKRLKA